MVSHVTCLGLVGILDFTVLCQTGMVLHLIHLAVENQIYIWTLPDVDRWLLPYTWFPMHIVCPL